MLLIYRIFEKPEAFRFHAHLWQTYTEVSREVPPPQSVSCSSFIPCPKQGRRLLNLHKQPVPVYKLHCQNIRPCLNLSLLLIKAMFPAPAS